MFPFAIADSERQVPFSVNTVEKEGNTYIKESTVFTSAKNTTTVQCYSIDGLLKQGYAKPDIIKIDAEGAEYDILQGAADTLKQYKPYLLLATHDHHLPGVKDKCVAFLQSMGYRLKHTGGYNKQLPGLDDFIAIHPDKM